MIIGISGYQGSGKDTVANVIVNKLGYKRESFAAPIKDMVSKYFGIDRDVLEGTNPDTRYLREAVSYGKYGFTPRELLMNIGAYFNREISKTFWSDIVEQRYLQDTSQNIVISDVRFPCELDMIQKHGGFVIRVERPGFNGSEDISERSLEDAIFDYHIMNLSTIDVLERDAFELVHQHLKVKGLI